MSDRAWLVISGVSPSLWATRVMGRRQTLGRSNDCDARVVHNTVSRRHAEVWRQDGTLFIRDLDSRNGTYVNRVRISESSFTVGSEIRLGQVSLAVLESLEEDAANEDETELLSNSADARPNKLMRLSPGQVQVLNLLRRGLGEKEVAEKLCLSRHTVHTHIKHVYKLLGVQSRSQLLAELFGGGAG